MPKSNPSANLEHDDSIEENQFDQFAGGDGREELDLSGLDRGDSPEDAETLEAEEAPEAELESEEAPEAEDAEDAELESKKRQKLS